MSSDIVFMPLLVGRGALIFLPSTIKCSTADAADKLKWSETKVRRIKKILIDLAFIRDVQTKRENGEISGHFIKVM